MRIKKKIAVTFILSLIFSYWLFGDPRAERLIRLLKESTNYRVKVQAAISLGGIKKPEVVSALIDALNDSNSAVVIAVVNSLGKLGDPRALPYLEKIALDKKVDLQLKETVVRAIEQIKKIVELEKGKTFSIGGDRPRFLIAVGEMGNATQVGKGKVEQILKQMVKEELNQVPFVIVEEAKSGDNLNIKNFLEKNKLQGFLVQGSLIQLTKTDNIYMAVVSLMILTYPERSLKVMLQGRGGEGLKGGVTLTPEVEKNLKLEAIRAAVKAAIESLTEYLSGL